MTETELLPPFLKVLITSDGTISNMLEAWFNEAVIAKVNQQETLLPEHDVALLETAPQEQAIKRETELLGKLTHTRYLKAEALILSQRMSPELLACIESHEAGIGKALRQNRSETLREVLDWGIAPKQGSAWRKYRIVMQGQPVMLITEHFPIKAFASS